MAFITWGVATVVSVKVASVRERRCANKLPIAQVVADQQRREQHALLRAPSPRHLQKP
ncbi:MAG: hypothetical protein AW10_02864 [Candidatus Accumulibacter appositus]|uniref:Uncharacterized protein n=1 Tax=Candidatus Accumulibacter appositus TaxID=1454003 RepID=A0A011PP99_9PROT|nr:hypothetical protein [Accumulibacter sp.]EXI78710.1 MAG: hypothetical protein AW10_02864 [Candidatus Accumulibacter appositus]HRF03368.1 hypothetical protein [Accumulibacter sp.]